jgi:chromosome segregation ATPase
MDDPQYQLIVEQFGRLKDNIESRFKRLEADASHEKDLAAEKNKFVTHELDRLQTAITDHESRIRTTNDSVNSLKTTGTMIQTAISALLASAFAWFVKK